MIDKDLYSEPVVVTGDVSIGVVGTRLPRSVDDVLDGGLHHLGYLGVVNVALGQIGEPDVTLTHATAEFSILGEVQFDTHLCSYVCRIIDQGRRKMYVIPKGELVETDLSAAGVTAFVIRMVPDSDGVHLYVYTDDIP